MSAHKLEHGVKCAECEFNTHFMNVLIMHSKRFHGKDSKQYYDAHLKQIGDGKCSECDNETTYRNVSVGYRTTCSLRCGRIFSKRKILEEHGDKYDERALSIQNKRISTTLEKYGVKHTTQLSSVRDAMKKSTMKRYGVEYPRQSEAVNLKSVDKCFEKYGVRSQNSLPSFQLKKRATMLERYGVENPSQVPKFLKKAMDNGGGKVRSKQYTTIFRDTIRFHGTYEQCFITLCETLGVRVENGPVIDYIFDERKHKYYVDFKITTQNITRLIEIKSTYWYSIQKEKVDAKKLAGEQFCKERGWQYYFIINDEGTNKLTDDKFSALFDGVK